jgi:transporter family-2 protein
MTGPLAATLLVLIGGAFLAMQAPTNAMLVPGVGSPLNAALVSFLVGSLVLLAVALVARAQPNLAVVRVLPWYAWLGGAYGAVLVAALTYSAPKIGVGPTVTLAIAGQVAMAMVIDHYGWLGMARHPVNAIRLAGLALVVVGVVLVRRG